MSRTAEGWRPEVAGDGCRTPIRIWLVDDDEVYRTLLAEFLNELTEFDCSRHFPSAEAVIEALHREAAPDAILLDIDMGGMNGLEALRPIKALAGLTRVLMLTSFYDTQRKVRALEDGASDFLLKRFTVYEISERVHRACREPLADVSAANHHAGRTNGMMQSEANTILNWPERRAWGTNDERHRHDDHRQAPLGHGHRKARWRSASRGWTRGVRYFRTLMAALF